MSDDAGDYICNYMYYRNMMKRESICDNLSNAKVYSLFCHFPAFSTIEEQKQKSFVVDMLHEITQSLCS